MMKEKAYKRTVIAGDFHIPFEDKVAVKLWLKFLEWYKPEILVLNGDVIDCFSISKFLTSPLEGTRLKEEIDRAKELLARIVSVTPGCTRYFVFGNHEARLHKYMASQAREIYELVALEDLLGLSDNYVVVNGNSRENVVQLGDIYVGHWDRVSKFSSYTVKNIIADRGVNVVQSHTHRLGFYTQRFMDRTVYGWEIGCLCGLNPSYVFNPNWQAGFAVIEPYNNGKQHTFYLVKINDSNGHYSFAYGKKVFSVEKEVK